MNPQDAYRKIPSVMLGRALPNAAAAKDNSNDDDDDGAPGERGSGGGGSGSGVHATGTARAAGAGAGAGADPMGSAVSCSATIASGNAWLNPHSMDALQAKWVDTPYASLTRSFHGVTYKDASCYQSLRKRQDINLSMEHVTSGHSHHQAGRSAQAHRSYNRALQVWPENPDALVCRGALYTKDGDFQRALSDLKAARKYGR